MRLSCTGGSVSKNGAVVAVESWPNETPACVLVYLSICGLCAEHVTVRKHCVTVSVGARVVRRCVAGLWVEDEPLGVDDRDDVAGVCLGQFLAVEGTDPHDDVKRAERERVRFGVIHGEIRFFDFAGPGQTATPHPANSPFARRDGEHVCCCFSPARRDSSVVERGTRNAKVVGSTPALGFYSPARSVPAQRRRESRDLALERRPERERLLHERKGPHRLGLPPRLHFRGHQGPEHTLDHVLG